METVRVEPGAMDAGEPAAKIGDGGDHRRPGLCRAVLVRPVVAAGVETERPGSVQSRNAPISEIGIHERARHWPRHGDKPPRRLR